MCINKHEIYNRYFRRRIWVDCGKCPACQQKAANKRATRIRSNSRPDKQCLFVHLTYLNECCPYVLESDILARKDKIPVYRDYDRRWSRRKDSKSGKRNYLLSYHRLHEPLKVYNLVNDYGVHEFDGIDNVGFNLRYLTKTYHRRPTTLDTKGKIGIVYYPDVQNYIKKLKQYLKRKFNIDENSFSVYITSEYGTKEETYRPHFHLLIFFDRSLEAQFREAIVKSWTYAFQSITKRKLQPAISAAKYAASYVNKPEGFPPVLSCHSFRAKHSYSQGFGMAVPDFSFDKILEKIREGNLTYVRKLSFRGTPIESTLPIPSYVINRYFPRCKGYSRITDSAFHRLFADLGDDRGNFGYVLSQSGQLKLYRNLYFINSEFHLDYNDEDLRKYSVSLFNHMVHSGLSPQDYAQYFTSAWRQRASQSYRLLLEGKSIYEQLECYDNIGDYYTGDISNLSLDDMLFEINPNYEYVENPNLFKLNIALTEHLEQQFSKYIKQRSINAAYENLNYAEI